MQRRSWLPAALAALAACVPSGSGGPHDLKVGADAGTSRAPEAGPPDASPLDLGTAPDLDATPALDALLVDTGTVADAGGPSDTGATDAPTGLDAPGPSDTGPLDTGDKDAAPADAAPIDASPPDSGTPADAAAQQDGGADAGPDPLAALSDNFTGTSLDPSWSIHQAAEFVATVGGGHLTITSSRSLWFNAMSGPAVYKTVTGDFKATSRVHARRASDPTMYVDRDIQLAGLIARDPSSDVQGMPENYVLVVVGHYTTGLVVETKTTVNSGSSYSDPAWATGDAELRVCRLGTDFYLFKRPIGTQTWMPAATFMRPNIGAQVQVGPIAYTPNVTDLAAMFDNVTFASVSALSDCTAD